MVLDGIPIISNREMKWKDKLMYYPNEMKVFDEFEFYGHIVPSDRYKQGVDIDYVDGRVERKKHGIYILRDNVRTCTFFWEVRRTGYCNSRIVYTLCMALIMG